MKKSTRSWKYHQKRQNLGISFLLTCLHVVGSVTIANGQIEGSQSTNFNRIHEGVWFTLLFIIPRIVLLSSIHPKAETLDFSTHPLPRNLLKIFPPHEHKQRQHCQAIW